MVIGLDLDNTIVNYDEVFRREALARGWVPETVPPVKDAVRDHLRARGREEDWILLQGHVYGPGMSGASLFAGVREFIARAKAAGAALRVISHKTREPFRGPKHDLHAFARRFLEGSGLGLAPGEIFLEETKAAKLERIRAEGCTHFIDDLPEFLGEPGFPAGVERWLFDPSGRHECAFPRAGSWTELSRRLLEPAPTLQEAAARLLESAGLGGDFELSALAGAANNRVFRVDLGEASLALKAYFKHPDDARDRLGAEFAFARYAWGLGLRQLPEPLACDPDRRLALYGFLEGQRLHAGELSAGHVEQALAFLLALNADRGAAAALPPASEACFSLAQHRELVGRRVERLLDCPDERARRFARERLKPAHDELSARLEKDARDSGTPFSEPLPEADRCVSPSDFGFHNALAGGDGVVRFLDFEYAGWDDPARAVCDFFCQQAVPVPARHYERFAAGVAELFDDPEMHLRRMALLMPLERLKWCCILLNDFLAVGLARRRFAEGGLDPQERQAAQLEKAQALFEAIAGGPAVS